MKWKTLTALFTLFFTGFLLTSCHMNEATGDPAYAAGGAAAGAGVAALLRAPGPVVGIAGIGGAAVGYYVTTLQYQSQGIKKACGKVYKIGDYIGIYIPSDKLFEVNTADFLPSAPAILDSAAEVLKRNPNNNILISGNTSGFGRPRWEQKLSEKRAERVAGYLWSSDISQFKERSLETRKLNYVGYGNYVPISSDLTNNGIRENSRIQITSYPTDCELNIDKKHMAMRNIGGDDTGGTDANCGGGGC